MCVCEVLLLLAAVTTDTRLVVETLFVFVCVGAGGGEGRRIWLLGENCSGVWLCTGSSVNLSTTLTDLHRHQHRQPFRSASRQSARDAV